MPIWGQNLTSLALTFQRAVPLFLEKCFTFILENHLDTEGIFRVPGNEADIKSFITSIDAIGDISVNSNTNAFVICNIITRFIRDVPDHILLDKNANKLQDCKTPADLKKIIMSLPIPNRAILSRLLGFMTIISQHSENNLMPISNIAIILSPILVDDPSNPQYLLSKDISIMLLENYREIFSEMLAIDANGNWLSEEQFTKSIGDVMTTFFCQSSFLRKPLTPIKIEKQARMVRNIKIDTRSNEWDCLMNELLAINPTNQQISSSIPLTKL